MRNGRQEPGGSGHVCVCWAVFPHGGEGKEACLLYRHMMDIPGRGLVHLCPSLLLLPFSSCLRYAAASKKKEQVRQGRGGRGEWHVPGDFVPSRKKRGPGEGGK